LKSVQTNLLRLNCFFKDFSSSAAVTTGLNGKTERALDLSLFDTMGSEAEFLTPINGCLLCLTVLTEGVPEVGFFL
jgi:hypothetical protein